MAVAPTVLIMGPPGAGKGTQAAHIVEAYGLRHVATGDVLRDAVKRGTELGRKAKSFMDDGGLVPDDVMVGLLADLMRELPEGSGVLLDGFPRTLPQVEALTSQLEELGRQVDAALDVRVPHDVLVRRLSSRWICRNDGRPYNTLTNPPQTPGVCDVDGGELYQRPDDQPEAVEHRLGVYSADTAPVSAYYEERGVLHTIDGDQAMDAVEGQIDRVLAPLR